MPMTNPMISRPRLYYLNLLENRRKYLAIVMVIVGMALLTLSTGYYLFSNLARVNLHELDYNVGQESPNQLQVPAETIQPSQWESPRWAKVSDFPKQLPIGEYSIIDETHLRDETGIAPFPIRLRMPTISLSSSIKELKIVNLKDDRTWETPKDVVGHIPSTARPGEKGNVYLFGHLHSPIKGEGSVFKRLTAIPELLKKGEDVYIEITNQKHEDFLYKVIETKVVHRDDFSLNTTNRPIVTLVACVPKYVYDHRLLVVGQLIGTK